MFARIDAWAVAHPWWTATLALIAWWLITGIASWATFPSDDKEWERIQREEPRRAGVLLVLRGWGFYPTKVLNGFGAIIFGRLTGTSKPPTLPPAIGGLLALALLAIPASGCAYLKPAAKIVVSDAKIACAISNAILGDAEIRTVCAIVDEEWQILEPYLRQHRLALIRAKATMRAGQPIAPKATPSPSCSSTPVPITKGLYR